jgi:hypothetical protein
MDWERWLRWPRGEDWSSLVGSGSAADWWMVGLTAVLTVAAVAAGLVALRQLAAIDAQLRAAEQARRTSIRPVVFVRKAYLLPAGESARFVELCVHNVGMAAARDVELKAWVYGIPDEVLIDRPNRFEDFRMACESQLETSRPPYRVEIEALGADREERAYLRSESGNSALPLSSRMALVFVTARIKDLDGGPHYYPYDANPGRVAYLWRVARYSDREPEMD